MGHYQAEIIMPPVEFNLEGAIEETIRPFGWRDTCWSRREVFETWHGLRRFDDAKGPDVAICTVADMPPALTASLVFLTFNTEHGLRTECRLPITGMFAGVVDVVQTIDAYKELAGIGQDWLVVSIDIKA